MVFRLATDIKKHHRPDQQPQREVDHPHNRCMPSMLPTFWARVSKRSGLGKAGNHELEVPFSSCFNLREFWRARRAIIFECHLLISCTSDSIRIPGWFFCHRSPDRHSAPGSLCSSSDCACSNARPSAYSIAVALRRVVFIRSPSDIFDCVKILFAFLCRRRREARSMRLCSPMIGI